MFRRKSKVVLTAEELKIRRKENWQLIISGILAGISFAPFPFPFTLLLFIAFIPLFDIIEKKENLADINKAVYKFGFVFCFITLYWVGSWQRDTDPFLMISGVVLLFFNPATFLIPSTVYYLSRKIFKSSLVLYFLPIVWAAYEYLYMMTDASFPWLVIGNGLSKSILFIQAADIVGALGLTILVLTFNVLVLKSIKYYKVNKPSFTLNFYAALFLLGLWGGYGFSKINNYKESKEKLRVGIVQPNLDPWEKWGGFNLTAQLNLYLTLSQQAATKNIDLLIWPETALPVYLLEGGYKAEVDTIYSYIRRNNIHLLTGMPSWVFYSDENAPKNAKRLRGSNQPYATYNSILLFSPTTNYVPLYGKEKLVPFGERVPFVDALPFLGDLIKWGVGISGWNVGNDTTVFKVPLYQDTAKINAVVCYESIYPYYFSRFIDKGANLIVVVTNDSWYGNSSGPRQHKDFASLRAVENRRSVVRCANGGISCVIDPLGRTLTQSEMFQQSVIVSDVSLNNGTTFFSRYPSIFPLICLGFMLWIVGLNVLFWIKKKYLTDDNKAE